MNEFHQVSKLQPSWHQMYIVNLILLKKPQIMSWNGFMPVETRYLFLPLAWQKPSPDCTINLFCTNWIGLRLEIFVQFFRPQSNMQGPLTYIMNSSPLLLHQGYSITQSGKLILSLMSFESSVGRNFIAKWGPCIIWNGSLVSHAFFL